MSNIHIQRVSMSELADLQTLGRQTFLETFADSNDPINMHKYLEESFALKKLESELKQSQSEFYFAKRDNENIGYLKINFGEAQTELQNPLAMEIERIYVLQAYHGLDVGQALFNQALTRAIENKMEFLWLGVWEKNKRAVHFYQKNGFVEFDQHIFKLGDEEQTDILMKLVLPQKAL